MGETHRKGSSPSFYHQKKAEITGARPGWRTAFALDEQWKGRVPSAGNVVEVDQDRHRSLAPVGREAGPIFLVCIEGIEVGHICIPTSPFQKL